MKKILSFLKTSVLFENPVLALLVGITPLLAASTKLIDGAVLGLCAVISLCISSMLFYGLKRVIPENYKDVAYILIVAAVISLCEVILRAFLPSVCAGLGIYLPLLSVSGLVFSRSVCFAKNESLKTAVLSGLSCGVGYLAVALALGIVREFFGRGSLAGFAIIPEKYAISLIAGPVGGFMLLAVIVAVRRKFVNAEKIEEEKK